MREIRTHGSMSGRWKRSMVKLVRHRQPKGSETDRLHLSHRATSRLYSMRRFLRLIYSAENSTLLSERYAGLVLPSGTLRQRNLFLEGGDSARFALRIRAPTGSCGPRSLAAVRGPTRRKTGPKNRCRATPAVGNSMQIIRRSRPARVTQSKNRLR